MSSGHVSSVSSLLCGGRCLHMGLLGCHCPLPVAIWPGVEKASLVPTSVPRPSPARCPTCLHRVRHLTLGWKVFRFPAPV